jgi:hypothetical protein
MARRSAASYSKTGSPALAGGDGVSEDAAGRPRAWRRCHKESAMPRPSLLAVALAALFAASAAQAQSAPRKVTPVPNTAVPSASTRAAQAAPNPAGLRPLFPAGLSSGSGVATSTDPVAASGAVAPADSSGIGLNNLAGGGGGGGGRVVGNSGLDGGLVAPNTAVLGAGSAGLMAAGPGQGLPVGGSGLNATELARAFINADSNRDGELTRSEARRLSFAPLSFEEMDRNFDGIITRAEFDDGAR